MVRLRTAVVCVAAGLLGVVLLATGDAAGQKEEPPGDAPGIGPKPVEKWEYAELHYQYTPQRRLLQKQPPGGPAGRGGFGGSDFKGKKGGKGNPGGPDGVGPGGAAGGGPDGGPGAAAGRGGIAGPGGAMPANVIIQPARTTVTWITADAHIEASGWEDMAKKLKALPARKTTLEEHHKLRALNRLGADGWEVYAHRPSEFSPRAEVWLMKRKVK